MENEVISTEGMRALNNMFKPVERPHKSTTHEEMYFHIREPHTDKKGKKYKAGTVFARNHNGFWFMTVARCSEADNFCREVGRNVARRRFFEKSFRTATGILWSSWKDCGTSKEKPTYDEALTYYKSI